MTKRGLRETRSRSEITENVEKTQTEVQEKTDTIEEKVSDVETESQTLENLELDGTSEGAETVEQNIEQAQDISVEEFTEQSGELEQMHEEAEQSETELAEKAESVSGDIETLSETSENIHSETARERLNEADRSAQEDMEFLNEHKQKLEQIRQESISEQDRQEQRVNTHRRN